MRIPHTIPTAAFEAFRCSEETQLLSTEVDRKLRAEDLDWDLDDVDDLKTICLRVIANNWINNPIDLETLPTTDDRDLLLELLPLDLPFEIAIEKLPYEHYWKRASESRWKYVDVWSHGGSWLQLYCERHLSELLECAEPTYFEAEIQQYERLLRLVETHVRTLQLGQLLPLRNERKDEVVGEGEDDDDDNSSSEICEFEYHHIPMDVILNKLPNLREISINIGMIYKSDGVEWQDFEFSVDDSLRLGRGCKDLLYLSKFRLTKSALNRARAAALLRGLAASQSIVELDFSHCKLGSEGAQSIGGYLAEIQSNQPLRYLRLTNNDIGSIGMAGITRGLLEGQSHLIKLDLRLNPIGDDGAKHLAALLLRYGPLEELNVSGCYLTSDAGMSIAEVLASGKLACTTTLRIDCSNNDLGSCAGEAFEIVAKSCPQLVELDARMCGFRRESEFAISESVYRNYTRSKKKIDYHRKNISGNVSEVEINDRCRNSLQVPQEYHDYQRRRPAQNLAPSIMTSSVYSVTTLSEGEEEEEYDDNENEDDDENNP